MGFDWRDYRALLNYMDVSRRKWWIKNGNEEQGPIDEETFQARLRAGEFSLKVLVKSDAMEDWEPLLSVVTTDATFLRPSKLPPPATEQS